MTELSDDQADALMLRAYERGIVGARDLPRLIREWRQPEHEDFKARTVWSFMNAVTAALRDRATARPSEYARQTMQLNGLLDQSRLVKVESVPVAEGLAA
jgi:hypothetical protein